MRERFHAQWNTFRAKSVERWILFANISFYMNIAMALGKLLLGVSSASVFLCINALYNAGMALARIVAVRGYKSGQKRADSSHPHGYGKREYHSYFAVGLILTVTSAVYIIYSLRLFRIGDSTHYDTIPAITIATIAFAEIGTAAYGISATRKYKAPAVSAIKMTNLASALISLVLTQMAILSFTAEGEVAVYNGLIGVLMGVVSALIGVGMMIHMSRILSGGYESTVCKRLVQIVQRSRSNLQVQPILYEDYGPKTRRLYVHVRGNANPHELARVKARLEQKTGAEMISIENNVSGKR